MYGTKATNVLDTVIETLSLCKFYRIKCISIFGPWIIFHIQKRQSNWEADNVLGRLLLYSMLSIMFKTTGSQNKNIGAV